MTKGGSLAAGSVEITTERGQAHCLKKGHRTKASATPHDDANMTKRYQSKPF
jgi:hypothetical protein